MGIADCGVPIARRADRALQIVNVIPTFAGLDQRQSPEPFKNAWYVLDSNRKNIAIQPAKSVLDKNMQPNAPLPAPQSAIQNPKSKPQYSPLPSGPVWLIANPTAGGHRTRRHLDRAVALLQTRLALVEIRWTQRRGDAQQWAREAADAHAALVIGYGGDGTLNEIANGLVGSNTALGILPAGTGNVVASELDIPRDPLVAAHALLAGRIEHLAIGRAHFSPAATCLPPSPTTHNAQPAPFLPPHYFLFSAGIGFDATVCGRITPLLKRWFGRGAYIFDGLREYARYRSPRLQVSLDGAAPVVCSELLIANGHYYAGRFVIAPDASPRDANLDVCLFTRPGRWNLLRYALAIITRRHIRLPDVICRKVQALDVAADRPVPLQLDGDTVGTTPARFAVCPQALAVVTPAPA